MSDIAFYCEWCRHRLVVEDRGAEEEVPCPLCGNSVVIPPVPVWLPAINEALGKIVQSVLAGKQSLMYAKLDLQNAIIATEYSAQVESDGPEDLMAEERIRLALETNLGIARGYAKATAGDDPDVFDEWPALEFLRFEDRKSPRGSPWFPKHTVYAIGWPDRWRVAAQNSGDIAAARVIKATGRMVASKLSPIWQVLGESWEDSFGYPFSPFAIGSGMDVIEVAYEEARELGFDCERRDNQNRRTLPPLSLVPIEDRRITDYLWYSPVTCDHCSEVKPAIVVFTCEACGEDICTDCRATGCSDAEGADEPQEAVQHEPQNAQECYREAGRLRELLTFPLGKQTAEALLALCDRAFEFGFSDDLCSSEAQTHKMCGEALESLGFKDRALREYEQAMEKDPRVGVTRRIASLRKEHQELVDEQTRKNST